MTRLSFLSRNLTTLFLLLFLTGCGYRLVGTGSALPAHIKTVAVPLFENSSDQPEIQREITSAVRQAFLNDGRLKLVSGKKAHLVIKGDLNYYNVRAVSFDSTDIVTEYVVQIGVAIDAKDRVKRKTFLKQNLRTKWDYRTSANVVNTEVSRLEALDQAYRDLASKLVNLIIERF